MASLNSDIEMSVTLLNWFKELSGYDNDKFLEYMNKNNVWNLLNNRQIIRGCMWAEAEDIIRLFGGYLSEDEKTSIISRNNSRFSAG